MVVQVYYGETYMPLKKLGSSQNIRLWLKVSSNARVHIYTKHATCQLVWHGGISQLHPN